MYERWITNRIPFNIVTSSISAQSFDTWIGSQSPWWATNFPVQNAVGAEAAVKQTGIAGTPFTIDSYVVYTTVDSITADAIILNVKAGSVTADAAIEKEQADSFAADADIACVGLLVWVSPADTIEITPNPVLVFTIPYSYNNIHFEIELDTVNTFSSGDYRLYQTYVDQAGWEYWDGDSWEPFPAGGISNTYAGNNCRLAITSPLTEDTWYRRVRGGVV